MKATVIHGKGQSVGIGKGAVPGSASAQSWRALEHTGSSFCLLLWPWRSEYYFKTCIRLVKSITEADGS